MEKKQNTHIFVKNLKWFVILLVVTGIYLVSRAMLEEHSIYYRTWVIVLGDIVSFIVLPFVTLLLPVTAALQWRKRAPERWAGKILVAIVSLLVGAVSLCYVGMGFIVFVFTAEEEFEIERMIADGIMEGERRENQGFDSHVVYHYYEPIAGFLKKPYEPLSEAIEVKVSEKYGELFVACEADKQMEQQMFLRIYTMQPVENPELKFHIYSGAEVFGITDDYRQARTNWILDNNAEFTEIANMPQEDVTQGAESEGKHLCEAPIVPIYNVAYGIEKSGIIAQAVAELMEDEICKNAEYGRAYITLTIWKGNMQADDIYVPIADYVNEAWIVEKIAEEYVEFESNEIEVEKVPEALSNHADSVLSEEEQMLQADTGTPQTIEGAYLCLYEAIFEPEGEPYAPSYNAKGNFYALLSREERTSDGTDEKMEIEKKVVYDRVSENGECHLFVYYETWIGDDGAEYTTAIRNTYAVNMETGEVFPSGKHAWEDVGTEEFREATGEK